MKEISVQELKSWKESGKTFQLIDVRDNYEYEWNNIDGTCIPLNTVLDNLDRINREGDVVIHCNSGNRAVALIDILTNRHGFNNLINLKGGIEAWAEEIDSSKMAY
ncbi:MAG: NADH oxidase [Crocinitomicaceae bacterium]|nr:NADH oxidase [Crocinitomicaceae bacterium]|tara:strand:- start:1644 stop:1961 length:318 start_codon:yes stop_codon:yes gene_type:complete